MKFCLSKLCVYPFIKALINVYSLKFLKVKNFQGFLSGLKNFVFETFGSSQAPLEKLVSRQKFYHENFFLKKKSLNLKNFNPRIYGIL